MNPPNDNHPSANSSANEGIWHRQANETASAYSSFAHYLDLGADATHQQVADLTGKSLSSIQKLSIRHRWLERAGAWSDYLAGNKRVAMATQDLQDRKRAALRQNILRRMNGSGLRNFVSSATTLLNLESAVAPYPVAG
jgi:hypothetical protein